MHMNIPQTNYFEIERNPPTFWNEHPYIEIKQHILNILSLIGNYSEVRTAFLVGSVSKKLFSKELYMRPVFEYIFQENFVELRAKKHMRMSDLDFEVIVGDCSSIPTDLPEMLQELISNSMTLKEVPLDLRLVDEKEVARYCSKNSVTPAYLSYRILFGTPTVFAGKEYFESLRNKILSVYSTVKLLEESPEYRFEKAFVEFNNKVKPLIINSDKSEVSLTAEIINDISSELLWLIEQRNPKLSNENFHFPSTWSRSRKIKINYTK